MARIRPPNLFVRYPPIQANKVIKNNDRVTNVVGRLALILVEYRRIGSTVMVNYAEAYRKIHKPDRYYGNRCLQFCGNDRSVLVVIKYQIW